MVSGKGKEGAEAEEAAAAGKGSRKSSERALAAPGRAKQAKGTLGKAKAFHGGGRTGRPKGSRNKPETPARVVAVGLDVPRLDDLKAAAEARKAADDEVKNGKPDGYEFGRPTGYRPEYAATARAMCKLGATDMELAEEFEVKTSTIWRWRSKFPDFCSALLEGKEAFDDRIERSLAQRAAGYTFHSQKVFNYEGCVVRADTIEHIPPDVSACKLWLHNRRSDTWREKSEVKIDSDGAFLKLWAAISDGTIN